MRELISKTVKLCHKRILTIKVLKTVRVGGDLDE